MANIKFICLFKFFLVNIYSRNRRNKILYSSHALTDYFKQKQIYLRTLINNG